MMYKCFGQFHICLVFKVFKAAVTPVIRSLVTSCDKSCLENVHYVRNDWMSASGLQSDCAHHWNISQCYSSNKSTSCWQQRRCGNPLSSSVCISSFLNIKWVTDLKQPKLSTQTNEFSIIITFRNHYTLDLDLIYPLGWLLQGNSKYLQRL